MEALTSSPPSTAPAPWPSSRPLRAWQQSALDRLRDADSESFLLSATPAAGKTTFGLRAAHELLQRGVVQRVCILAPTTACAALDGPSGQGRR